MFQWKNISSFAQGDTDRTPRTWELKVGDFRLVVTRHRDFAPDEWVLRAAPFFDLFLLDSKDEMAAKLEAQRLVSQGLARAADIMAKVEP